MVNAKIFKRKLYVKVGQGDWVLADSLLKVDVLWELIIKKTAQVSG